MATAFCPHCSDLVERSGQRCGRCGADLFATFADPEPFEDTPRVGGPLEFPTGSTFAGRYTIIERIGAGGMGVVYKAIDTMLDGEVALKLMQPALAQMPGFIERFRREVRITRQITHPNICRFHDIGEVDAILYVSMEWIEGETLRQLLEQTGTLRDARALEIAEKIALALKAAHDKGIIHRDLKPANVMLDRRGNVFVLDFGLALQEGSEDITETGVLLGTLAYMAPEQQRLQPLDARADLYALGLILREMLTGTRLDPVPGLTSEIRSVINPVLVPVLESLLAIDPAARCPSAAAARKLLRDAREHPGISTVVTHRTLPAPGSRRRSWLLPGIAGLATALAAGLWIVLGPGSTDLDPRARVLFEQGMRALSEGIETARGAEEAITKFHQALDIEPDSAHLYAALGEANWLRYRLSRGEVYREEAERAVTKAYELDPRDPTVLEARAVGFIETGKFQAAKRELEAALERSPETATAWIYLSEVELAVGDHVAALEALRRAVKLAPGSYWAHVAMGRYHERFYEWDEATKAYRKASELRPDSPIAWNNLGAAHLQTGRTREAIPVFERSILLEDRASTRSNLGTAYYFLGRYEDAAGHYRRAIELQPDAAVHHANLGDALLKLGRDAEYLEAYRRAAELAREAVARSPRDPHAQGTLALYCAKVLDAACALEAGAAAAELRPDDATITLNNAVLRAILGRDDECLEWLDRAVKLGATRSQIELTPELERFGANPGFREIVDRAS
jgi:serine/threonine-protein kinase